MRGKRQKFCKVCKQMALMGRNTETCDKCKAERARKS